MKKKIRAKLVKGAELKFISHLDLMNTLNRALRRARIPVAYSQGYNPTPNVSFASALAVGLTSNSEYIDVELEDEISPIEFKEALNNTLPQGLEIISAKRVEKKVKSLMAQVNLGNYLARIELERSATLEELKDLIKDFLSQDEIMFKRKRRKKKDRIFDIKPLIFSVKVLGVQDELATFSMSLQTGSSGNLRPEEVINALANYSDLIKPAKLINIHRTALSIKDGDEILTPLDVI